jgi:hypothetical protein
MYIHKASSRIYKLIGYGKCVTNPSRQVVIYEQKHESIMRETGQILEKGTIWIRDASDFSKKFKKL